MQSKRHRLRDCGGGNVYSFLCQSIRHVFLLLIQLLSTLFTLETLIWIEFFFSCYPRHSFSFSQKFTIFRKSSLDIPQQSSNYSRPSGYTEGSKHLHGAPSKQGIPRRVDCVCPTCAFRPELFGSSTADLWVWTSFVVVLSWALEGCLGLPRWH